MAIIEIDSKIEVFTKPPKLNIFIVDVSGSMGWAMARLSEDTAKRVRTLPTGDAVLIGIFSTKGWFKWVAARELSSEKDYELIIQLIKENFHVVGLTCFSDILGDTPQAIKPFLPKFSVVTLTFMSDGHPVVPNYNSEISSIQSAISALKGLVTSGAIIAYGDYANRPLLSDMASNLGVEMVSTEEVEEIGNTFERVAKSKTAKRKRVTVPKSSQFVFSVDSEGNIVALHQDPDNVVLSASDSKVYAIDQSKGQVSETLSYAAALALLSVGRIEEAMQTLSDIGDVAFVTALGNALTNAELSRCEQNIRAAVTSLPRRFVGGKKVGCLPAEDAFDLIDLMNTLSDDPEAKFYPYDESFEYKRIGRSSEVEPGYPKFFADKDPAVPICGLSGHSEELNLSVLAKIDGVINLPEKVNTPVGELDRDKIGLSAVHKCHIFRNYSVISNALPWVKTLPVSMSSETFSKLKSVGVIDGPANSNPIGNFELLDLTRLPACNRARGKSATDWYRLGELAVTSLKLGAILKVYKAKRDELDPDKSYTQPISLTDEQAAFLSACGVRNDGSFSPPTKQSDPIDIIDIRTFSVKVKGSSPVSMKDFKEMLAGTKKMNWMGELMKQGIIGLNLMPDAKGPALKWLYEEIQSLTTEKRKVDAELFARRFAVAASGIWTKHCKEDSMAITVGGHPVSIEFKVNQKKI